MMSKLAYCNAHSVLIEELQLTCLVQCTIYDVQNGVCKHTDYDEYFNITSCTYMISKWRMQAHRLSNTSINILYFYDFKMERALLSMHCTYYALCTCSKDL